MTDQPTDPRATGTTQPAQPAQPTQPTQPTSPNPPPAAPRTLEERMEDLGHRAESAGERFGRDAEAAARRWSKDPTIVGAADTATRVWGLLVLAVGLWFFADITLGMEMPAIAWRDLWPIVLIVLGLAVLVRGMAGRRA